MKLSLRAQYIALVVPVLIEVAALLVVTLAPCSAILPTHDIRTFHAANGLDDQPSGRSSPQVVRLFETITAEKMETPHAP